MGSFWTMLFETLTGWVRGIVSGIWSSFNPGSGGNFFSWLIDHWFVVLIVICVIGAAADLIVYLFRWQPYRVWKRLFHKSKSDEAEKTVYTEDDLVGLPESFDEEEETYAPEEEEPTETGYWTWDNGQNETGNEAGYSTPMAWNREEHPEAEPDPKAEYEDRMARYEQAIKPRRRRRLAVADFFSNGEEPSQAAAPQSLIDQREAYRKPVYPSGWKGNDP